LKLLSFWINDVVDRFMPPGFVCNRLAGKSVTGKLWETHADWWQKGFTEGADPEYEEQILPLAVDLLKGFDRILDVGCGEGQITRLLAALNSEVLGIDATWAQIAKAAARSTGECYVRASAEALPFRNHVFDAAIACLVFEHIVEMEDAIREVARVLRSAGRFVLILNHPLLQTPGSGWVDDHMVDPPNQYWRIGDYLIEQETVEEVELGVHIPFVHRPLSIYINALSENGLAVERMLEPPPPEGFIERNDSYAAASFIPRLLVLICRKG
jgi:SAM-dependent methyltransferase